MPGWAGPARPAGLGRPRGRGRAERAGGPGRRGARERRARAPGGAGRAGPAQPGRPIGRPSPAQPGRPDWAGRRKRFWNRVDKRGVWGKVGCRAIGTGRGRGRPIPTRGARAMKILNPAYPAPIRLAPAALLFGAAILAGSWCFGMWGVLALVVGVERWVRG